MADGRVDVIGVLGGGALRDGRRPWRRPTSWWVRPGSWSRRRCPTGPRPCRCGGRSTPSSRWSTERAAAGGQVCVLASGDPGFFGIVRALGAWSGPDRLAVHPARRRWPSPSPGSGSPGTTPWSCRPTAGPGRRRAAVTTLRAGAPAGGAPKVAVLTAPDTPPQVLGRALVEAGCGPRTVAVASTSAATVSRWCAPTSGRLAGGTFDPMSVVVLVAEGGRRRRPAWPGAPCPSPATPAWRPPRPRCPRTPSTGASTGAGPGFGLPVTRYDHRDGMITEAQVRAVALSKLYCPRPGARCGTSAPGSGSVGIESARLAPALSRRCGGRSDHGTCRRAQRCCPRRRGEDRGGAPTEVLGDLPDPDRAFVGGGIDVLDAVQLGCPRRVVVATYSRRAGGGRPRAARVDGPGELPLACPSGTAGCGWPRSRCSCAGGRPDRAARLSSSSAGVARKAATAEEVVSLAAGAGRGRHRAGGRWRRWPRSRAAAATFGDRGLLGSRHRGLPARRAPPGRSTPARPGSPRPQPTPARPAGTRRWPTRRCRSPATARSSWPQAKSAW